MSLMRYRIAILLLLSSLSALAQTLPDYGQNKVRIALPDKQIVAELNPVPAHIRPKSTLWYFWYDANVIHTTQGGFGGKLLDGTYQEFFINKNLEMEGHF